MQNKKKQNGISRKRRKSNTLRKKKERKKRKSLENKDNDHKRIKIQKKCVCEC